MDIMKDLETLCDVLFDQLKDVTRKSRNGISSGDLENIDKLTHSIASIKKIMAFMEDDGYSGHDGYREAYRGSYRGGSYKRDRMGRYSSGYSRNDLADKMRELMHDAPDDRTRQEMQRMVEKLENA